MFTLAEAKAHLRVDHADEDSLLQSYIETAQSRVETMLGFELSTYGDGGVPADVLHAGRLCLTDLYDFRVATTAEHRGDAASGLSRIDKAMNSLLMNHRQINPVASETA